MEFMRFIHFTGKLIGRLRVDFKNLNDEDSYISSMSFMGFTIYKVSENNLRMISELMNKGGKYFDERIIELQTETDLETDKKYQEALKKIDTLESNVSDLKNKNSQLSASVLNLKYAAETIVEKFANDDILKDKKLHS